MNEYDRQPELVGLVPPLWSRGVADQMARHRGRWVALDGDRVIAVADTLSEVRSSAREQGIDEPLLFRVPSHPERVAAYLVQRSGS